ncbi:MAG: hypothetical protein Q8Q97_03100, partial [bacterium]|nr:hypothetical protein [bacterium]
NDSVEITAIYGAVFSILSIALIPAYGVYGAAAARLAGGALQIALYKRYLAKRNFVFSMVPDVADAKAMFRALASQLRGIIGMAPRAK